MLKERQVQCHRCHGTGRITFARPIVVCSYCNGKGWLREYYDPIYERKRDREIEIERFFDDTLVIAAIITAPLSISIWIYRWTICYVKMFIIKSKEVKAKKKHSKQV